MYVSNTYLVHTIICQLKTATNSKNSTPNINLANNILLLTCKNDALLYCGYF